MATIDALPDQAAATERTRAPRRRPEAGGYARGEEVRTRILLAAIRLFGERGFARTSTRAIAAAAAVNPPALQYYFHAKEQLYAACEQHIADRMAEDLRPPLARADDVLARGDRVAAEEALWALVDTVLDRSATEADMPGWAQFLFKALTDGVTGSLAIVRSQAADPLYAAVTALIGLGWGRPADDPAARMAAVLLLNQVNALGVGRKDTLARMGWPDFADGRLGLGKTLLRAGLAALLAKPPA